jgi:hypothetical protein
MIAGCILFQKEEEGEGEREMLLLFGLRVEEEKWAFHFPVHLRTFRCLKPLGRLGSEMMVAS